MCSRLKEMSTAQESGKRRRSSAPCATFQATCSWCEFQCWILTRPVGGQAEAATQSIFLTAHTLCMQRVYARGITAKARPSNAACSTRDVRRDTRSSAVQQRWYRTTITSEASAINALLTMRRHEHYVSLAYLTLADRADQKLPRLPPGSPHPRACLPIPACAHRNEGLQVEPRSAQR